MSPRTAVAESLPMPEATVVAVPERFARVAVDKIVPSKTNPRTHFDPVKMAELQRSVAEKGVVEPIIVRPTVADDVYEIVAGECRWRASKAAALPDIPAMIRPYSDEQALEVQLIENLHRNDLTPLEQAQGFRSLIKANPDKHSVESIATRIGKSDTWVWDRLKLVDLIDGAKDILEAGLISEGHAIRIARLKPADQARVIDLDRGGLWVQSTAGLEFAEADPMESERTFYDGYKPVSVRELERWIANHVRFDVEHAAKAQPLEFERLAEKVEAAQAQPGRGKKVVQITFDSYVQPEAKDDQERTYYPGSWRRADDPTCEHAILGVVVVGEGRGTSFDVCLAKDKCKIHWGKEIREREQEAKRQEKTADASDTRAKAQQREDREAAERKRLQERWAKLYPRLITVARKEAAALPNALPQPLYAALLKRLQLPASVTPAQLPKALLVAEVTELFNPIWSYYDRERQLAPWCKLLGIDIAALDNLVPDAPAKKPAPKAKAAKPAKKAAKGKKR